MTSKTSSVCLTKARTRWSTVRYVCMYARMYVCMYSRPRFKDARVKSTPRVKDAFFFRSMVPRDCKCIGGGGHFISRPPQNTGAAPYPQAPRERFAAAPSVCRYSMRRFLPTAGASSASSTKPCAEPTCTIMAPVGPSGARTRDQVERTRRTRLSSTTFAAWSRR